MYHVWQFSKEGHKTLKKYKKKSSAIKYAKTKTMHITYVPEFEEGTPIYQDDVLYGYILGKTKKYGVDCYEVDRSYKFPNAKEKIVYYNASEFHIKFYNGLLEGKPKEGQQEEE